jgi:serine/arginine repetitive matrix protein 2
MSEEKENKAQPIKTQPLAIAKAKKTSMTTTALNQNVHERRKSVYKGPSASRPASGISFEGFTSFEEVRRGFEFSGDRPGFYPPPPPVPAIPSNVDSFSFGSSGNASYSFVPSNSSYNPTAARRAAPPHKRHESAFSIASVSSYGHVINPGSTDPFDYGALLMPSLQERPVSEDEEGDGDEGMSLRSVSMSMSVDDTFAFVAEQQRLHGGGGVGVTRGWRVRQRVESDASSFYFRPGAGAGGAGHRRRESNMSVSSQVPPVSMYNRSGQSSHGHSRNDSSASSSSVAMSYARYGANSGFGAWAASRYHQQHRRDMSVDGDGDDNMSVMSEGGRDFEAMRRERVGMGRPGVGEKMFGSPGDEEEEEGEEGLAPPPFGLTRIDASPLGVEFDQEGTYDYYDSILDGSDEPRRASVGSAGSRESRSGDNEYEDSIFEKTGYRSSMEVDGDDESSVFGRKVGGQQQGRGLFPPANASSRLSMMSNQSLSVGGLSDGNVREDDTMISVCFFFFYVVLRR